MKSKGASTIVRNMREFQHQLKAADDDRRKAGEVAVRVEAYRLKRLMSKEIRQGAPGGDRFAPLRTVTRRGGRSRKPLNFLARIVRYWVLPNNQVKTFSVGFSNMSSDAISRSAFNLAMFHTMGGSVSLSSGRYKGLRSFWARIGKRLRDSGKTKRITKYFFLKKMTTHLEVPARPIVEPFWDKHEYDAERNIVSNFNRKMRGDRI